MFINFTKDCLDIELSEDERKLVADALLDADRVEFYFQMIDVASQVGARHKIMTSRAYTCYTRNDVQNVYDRFRVLLQDHGCEKKALDGHIMVVHFYNNGTTFELVSPTDLSRKFITLGRTRGNEFPVIEMGEI